MADKDMQVTAVQENPQNDQVNSNVFRSYNYVGTKETIAYLFNDWSNTFNISGYSGRFVWDVVKIDFGISAIVGLFTGVWDVVNDIIVSAVVDNTRSRLGKFRPYLILLQIPLSSSHALRAELPPPTTATSFPL